MSVHALAVMQADADNSDGMRRVTLHAMSYIYLLGCP